MNFSNNLERVSTLASRLPPARGSAELNTYRMVRHNCRNSNDLFKIKLSLIPFTPTVGGRSKK